MTWGDIARAILRRAHGFRLGAFYVTRDRENFYLIPFGSYRLGNIRYRVDYSWNTEGREEFEIEELG